MPDTLNVQRRETRGSRDAKRLRAGGQIPAVLYGHGGENIALSLSAEELGTAMRRGARLVELTGDVQDSAIIRESQWDAFGLELLHIDLTRVVAGEMLETAVRVVLRGDAPGAREGGIVEHHMHEVQIRCPVTAIPEKLTLRINELGLGESILASGLSLPEGTELLTDSNATIVLCSVPAAPLDEDEAAAADGVEPEIIGRKAEEEGEDKSD